MSHYKVGDSYLLSLALDFEGESPILNMELFNPIERKEMNFQYDLANLGIELTTGNEEVATNHGHSVMRVRTSPNTLNINMEAVLKNIEINNL